MKRPCFAFLYLLSVFMTSACGLGPVTVRILYAPGGKGDRAANDLAFVGLLEARDQTGARIVEGSPADSDEAASILHGWLAEDVGVGRELVITNDPDYAELVDDLDCELRGRKWLHFDHDLKACETIKAVEYRTYGAAFLAGVASMAVAENKTAAVLAGQRAQAVDELLLGFTAGVEHAGGELVAVQFMPSVHDGMDNPEQGKVRARRLFEHADVIFPIANTTGLGVIEAAKEEPGRYVIGLHADQTHLGPSVVVGSIVEHLDWSIVQAVLEVDRFAYRGGREVHAMDDGAVEFVVGPVFADQVKAKLDVAKAYASMLEAAYEKGVAR